MPDPSRARFLAALMLLTTPLAAAQISGMTVYAGLAGGGSGLQRESTTAPAADQALRLDAGATASGSIEWTIDGARQIQLFVSHQRTSLELQGVGSTAAPQHLPLQMLHVHLGGTNFVDARVGQGVYVLGGLGLTRFSPGLAGFDTEVRASMNLGVGYAWPVTPGLGLRAELRGVAVLLNSSGSFLCSGGCAVAIKGDSLTQAQALLGASFSF
jgi:hypothetical protein